ncbi:MAG: alpha/beta hydrolase [Betaproteobacteria bacterium]
MKIKKGFTRYFHILMVVIPMMLWSDQAISLSISRNDIALYNPNAQYEIKITEVVYRKNAAGRDLIARIYQPQGEGLFPVVMDLHGGAWNNKDRKAEQPMDLALAKSGVLVVAIDMTVATESAYPANLQDAHYAIRWLKYHAKAWKGDPKTLGIYGSSTGGHVAELIGMKPFDPEYAAIPFPEAPQLDARIQYIAARSPISDPLARYQNAVKHQRERMINNHHTYFKPWSTIYWANPQYILDRKDPISKPPMLIIVGANDDNVVPEIQEKFVKSYRAAGGAIQLKIFPDSDHEWVAKEGLQTDIARKTVKEFIASQVNQ